MKDTRVALFALAYLAASSLSLVAQYSAYLPRCRELLVSPQYLYQSFDHLHAGAQRFSLGDLGLEGHLQQHTVQMALEYGIMSRLTIDSTFGHVSVRLPARNLEGMTDTSLGLRYCLIDELKQKNGLPTVSVRLGGILAGSYPTPLGLPPTNPGDGASGFETAALFGKSLGSTGVTLYGDLGYRNRSQGVPDDLFGTAGVAYEPCRWLLLSAAYRHEQSLSGIDILGPGFTGDFRVVREINRIVEFGVAFTDRRGRSLNLVGAFNVGGRNTGEKTILGISLTLPFELASPQVKHL